MEESFGDWLSGLGTAELSELLTARPDATALPQPETVRELAERLSLPHGAVSALTRLSLPPFQVLEALAALGDGTGREELRALLDAGETEFADALVQLARHGLVWPERDRLRLIEPLRLWPVGERLPLGLGLPAAELLPQLRADDLRRIARELGAKPAGQRKDELRTAVLTALRDGDLVRAVVASAPKPARTLLERVAAGEDVEQPWGVYGLAHARGTDPYTWAMTRGLLVQLDWQLTLMPAEVALALRGPDHRAPFTPRPPEVATRPVPAAAIEAEFASASTRAVEQVTALCELCAKEPLTRRKAGGIGVRELRRAVKATGCEEAAMRLWLELAFHAGLLAWQDTELVPTAEFDAWQGHEPSERLVVLLRTWPALTRLPLFVDDEDGAQAPLDHRTDDPAAPRLRAALLGVLADLPAGCGTAGAAVLVGTVMWHRPLLFDAAETAPPYLEAAWQEAEALGVVAHGALTPAGRAVAAGADDEALREACEVLSGSCETALFQTDLTAVVPGPPSARLAEVLDAAGEREVRGAASIWRFTTASVRRALDAGHTPDALVRDLREVATAGVPQPLEYLIGDVARRHGEVAVVPLACAICCPQAGLATELVNHRRLKALRLRQLAPTVLASAKPADETLTALREAGYMPIAHDEAGVPVIQQVPRRRAAAARTPGRRSRTLVRAGKATGAAAAGPRACGPAELAARLTGTSPTAGGSDPRLQDLPGHLSLAERRLLLHAIDEATPIRIDYVNGDGNPSSRVIHDAQLTGSFLTAWCRLRDDERVFNVGRITAVAPV